MLNVRLSHKKQQESHPPSVSMVFQGFEQVRIGLRLHAKISFRHLIGGIESSPLKSNYSLASWHRLCVHEQFTFLILVNQLLPNASFLELKEQNMNAL